MYQIPGQRTRQSPGVRFEAVPQGDVDYDDAEEQPRSTGPQATQRESRLTDARSTAKVEPNETHNVAIDNEESAPLHYAYKRANNPEDQPGYSTAEDVPRPDGGDNEQDIADNYPPRQPVGTELDPTWKAYDLEQGDHSLNSLLQTSHEGKARSVGEAHNYKPWPFRYPFMSILLLLILILLGLVGLAVHILPDGTKDAAPLYTIHNSTTLRLRSAPIHDKDVDVIQGHQEIREEPTYRLLDGLKSNNSLPILQAPSTSLAQSNVFSSPHGRLPVLAILESTTSNLDSLGSSILAAPNHIPKSYIPPASENLIPRTHNNTTTKTPTTSDGSGKTCTVTVEDKATTTVEDVTVTVGPEGPSATEASSTVDSDDSDCDTTLTITIAYSDYVTIGVNTVTVDLRTPTQTKLQKPDVTPTAADPTSTCYYTTVTEAAKADNLVAATTVTVDVTVLVDKRQPPLTLHPQPLDKRACVSGGVFTVTETIAVLDHTTVTEFNTVTMNVQGPTTTAGQPSPTDSPHVTMIPITTTDENGEAVTSAEASLLASGHQSFQTTKVTFSTTDHDGSAFLTTATGFFDPAGDRMTPNSDPDEPITSGDAQDDILTAIGTTLTNADGDATLTSSVLVHGIMRTTTRRDSLARPTRTESVLVLDALQTTTLTDARGEPTRTATFWAMSRTSTLTDEDGKPTATVVTALAETPSAVTLTDGQGRATATLTSLVQAGFLIAGDDATPASRPTSTTTTDNDSSQDGSGDGALYKVYAITKGQYFTGLILPTLLATALSIPIRILNYVAKLYQPFHTLALASTSTSTSPSRGARASAASSICLPVLDGIRTSLAGVRTRSRPLPLLPLTDLLVALSAALVPLGAETVRVVLQGDECRSGQGDADNCAVTVGVFPGPARVAVAVLAAMAVLVLLAAAVALRRGYRTGVPAEPWSLREMARLASAPEVREYLGRLRADVASGNIRIKDVVRSLEGKRFSLDYRRRGGDGAAMTVLVLEDDPEYATEKPRDDVQEGGLGESERPPRKKGSPFSVLTTWGRVSVMAVLCGLLILILVYGEARGSREFESFMASESLEVRLVFTSVGVIITLFWSSYFDCVAFVSPYKLIQGDDERSRAAAIHMSPPTNAFSGLYIALGRSRRDLYLGAVSVTAIMSEFLPALLNNVPYRVVQTHLAHVVCTWMAVGVLSVMVLVVLGSFFVDWPDFPIDPSTIVGAAFYAYDLQSSPEEAVQKRSSQWSMED
ncbi:hypothetical protein SLS62_007846 [Diatrype stigma]|uniref:Uncharacterized protein n=1 Tax=Diatrype stigma TaxID=117547 RepID=A0AAN9YN39_9PEZI